MTDQQVDRLKQIITLLDERLPKSTTFSFTIPELSKISTTLDQVKKALDRVTESLHLILERLEAKEQEKTSPWPLPTRRPRRSAGRNSQECA